MPEENPYRYEGTAEALAKTNKNAPAASPPSGLALFFAGVGAAVVAGFVVALINKSRSPEGSLFLAVPVLLPIGIYVASFTGKRDFLRAQIGFWFAAAPLPLYLYFFMMPTEHHWTAALTRTITKELLSIYGSQVCAAAAVMGLMTCRVRRGR